MTSLSTTVREDIRGRAAPDGGATAGRSSLTAGELVALLRRRIVLAVGLFVLFAGAVGAGFAAWWVYLPGYSSEALIECISNIPDMELSIEQQRLKQDEHERFVMTQALLMKSPNILGEALKVNAVRETDWYRSVGANEHLLVLEDDLKAAPVRGTNFLRVAMECRNAKDPAIIVNTIVSQWFNTVKKRTAEEFTDEALQAALQEQRELEQDVRESRERLRALAERLSPGAVQNPSGNIVAQQAGQYAEQVASLQLELSQLEEYRALYSDPEGVAVTAEDRAMVEQDPQVAELARVLFLLEQQRASDSKVYGSEHAELRRIDAQITAAEAKLAQLRMEKLNERRADIREAVNTAYENTRHALFLSQENLAKAEAALEDQDRLLFDYGNLSGEIENKVKRSQELDTYIKNLSRVKTQRSAIRVNIAQPATDPLERSSPSLLLFPIGVFFSLVLAVGIAMGLEVVNSSVRTSQDITRHLDVALLGLVPDIDDEEIDIPGVETAIRDAPQSMVAEAFRRLRTNLQFSAPADRQRSLVVTSANPEDGKTTCACNLAIALAQSGRRVLLVDANLHRPGLHRLFESVPHEGLSNLLIGDGSLASTAVRTAIPLLEVLGSGPTPPNPAELLGGERWRALLHEATSRYDQVIIDTAPVLLASDALVVASEADGVILVVRANRNSRGAARRACSLIAGVGGRLFGAVLNAAQVTRGGYFREQLRTFYEYQADREAPAPPVRPSKGHKPRDEGQA